MKYLICLSFLALCNFTSCGQLTSLQTAKTFEKGEGVFGAALSGYGINEDAFSGGETNTGVFPYLEVFGRYGLAPKLDMGIKISTAGNLLLDGKYQLIGNTDSRFAAAIGGGFEFQASNFNENIVYRLHLPLYFSYHPNEQSAIYVTPRYAFQSVSNDNNSYFLGMSGGYMHRLSDNFSGLIEGSLYSPQTQNTSNDGVLLYLFGIGGAFHF